MNTLARALLQRGIPTRTIAIAKHKFGWAAESHILSSQRDTTLWGIFRWLFQGTYAFSRLRGVVFTFGSSLFDPGNTEANLNLQNFPLWVAKRAMELLQIVELSILRLRRIPMIVIYQGSDARNAGGKNCPRCAATSILLCEYSNTHRLRRRKINRFRYFGAKIFAMNPDLLDYLPKSAEFLPYSVFQLDVSIAKPEADATRPLLISHAPSNRIIKGTAKIIEAVERLKNEGISIDIDLIENVTNAETIRRIASSDLFVDQLGIGWYGLAAVEAMSLGKPVLCYLEPEQLDKVPAQMAKDIPIVSVNEQSIEEALREFTQMSGLELTHTTTRSRLFVKEWHDAAKNIEVLIPYFR